MKERLELGEDSRVEFKETSFRSRRVAAPRRDNLADELAAFGNTLGGTVILSVSDRGKVRALDRDDLDRLESFVSEICADSILPPLSFITQRFSLSEGPMLVVDIPQSVLVHRSPGGYLQRQGSSKRELSPEALSRLFQQRGRSGLISPDELVVEGTGAGSLDPTLRDRFLSSRSDEPPVDQLVKLGLLRIDRAGVLRATVAGVLLCTETTSPLPSGGRCGGGSVPRRRTWQGRTA